MTARLCSQQKSASRTLSMLALGSHEPESRPAPVPAPTLRSRHNTGLTTIIPGSNSLLVRFPKFARGIKSCLPLFICTKIVKFPFRQRLEPNRTISNSFQNTYKTDPALIRTKSGLAGEEYARCSGRTKGGDTGQRAARVFFYRAAKAAGAGFTQGREGCGGRTFGNCRI